MEKKDDEHKLDAAKVKIVVERHIISLGERGLPWTILRPVFFMENFEGPLASPTATVWRAGLKPQTKIQLIAVDDVAKVALAVFNNPAASRGQRLLVRSERLTMSEIDAAYRRATGWNCPWLPLSLGRLILHLNPNVQSTLDNMEDIHSFVEAEGEAYEEYAKAVLSYVPHLETFEEWAKRSKERRLKPESTGNWNQVSVWRLITGRH